MKSAKSFRNLRGWVIIVSTLVFSAGIYSQTIKVEAESGKLLGPNTKVENAVEGYSGTGYVNGFNETADGVEVTVNVSKTGMYTVSVGFASPYGPKDNYISVNGTIVDTLHFQQIEGFTEVISGDYQLNAGNNTIGFHHFWGWMLLDYFKISDIAPRGDFSYSPANPATGDTVTFDASAAYDPNGTIEKYNWDFGDSKTDSGMIVRHVFASAGIKNVVLSLTDNDGNTTSILKTVDVARAEPYALFTFSPEFPEPGVSINFNGSASYDLTGTIDNYLWDFGDGQTATGATANHSFGAEGNYQVSLTVTNNRGRHDTRSLTIYVYNPLAVIRGPELLTTNPVTNSKIELDFQVKASYSNPFDPNQVMVDAVVIFPGAVDSIVVPCFYYERAYYEKGNWLVDTTIKTWRLRFIVEKAGTYQVKLKYTGPVSQYVDDPYEVIVAAGTEKGIVKNDQKNNQYYRHSTGEPFYPLGINIGWASIENYSKIVNNISANHANFFRYWHTPFARQTLEWSTNSFYNGLGKYSQKAAAMTDSLLILGKELDVYMQLVIFQHGPFSETVNAMWDENPYNTANGGFVAKAEDFFSNDSCKVYTKKLLRYIVARWGYSPNIFAWEFFNEVQFTGNHPNQSAQWFPNVQRWHSEMGRYIESIDAFDHIMTTSAEHDQLYKLDTIKSIDVLQYHLYNTSLLEEQKKLDCQFLKGLQHAVINGEYGEDVNTANVPLKKQQISLWNSIMTEVPHIMWLWDNYGKTEWGKLFYYPGEFLKDEDFSADGVHTPLEFSALMDSKQLNYTALAGDSNFYGVVYDEAGGTIEGAVIDNLVVPFGNYDISYYLSSNDEIVLVEDVPLIRALNKIHLPATTNDIAFKIKYKSDYNLPIALAGTDQFVPLGNTVTLDGSESLEPNDLPLAYSWSIVSKPTGSALTITNGANAIVQVVPDKSGYYYFALSVSNGTETSIPDTIRVISSTRPIASAGPDSRVKPRQYATLDGTASYDADGEPLTYLWTVVKQPAGASPTILNHTAPTATFRSEMLGSYLLTLVVDDGIQASLPDTVEVLVTNKSSVSNAITGKTTVYPVPASSRVTIAFSNPLSGNVDIEVFDLFSRLVKKERQYVLSDSSQNTVIFEFGNSIPQGVYVLRLRTKETSYTHYLVVE